MWNFIIWYLSRTYWSVLAWFSRSLKWFCGSVRSDLFRYNNEDEEGYDGRSGGAVVVLLVVGVVVPWSYEVVWSYPSCVETWSAVCHLGKSVCLAENYSADGIFPFNFLVHFDAHWPVAIYKDRDDEDKKNIDRNVMTVMMSCMIDLPVRYSMCQKTYMSIYMSIQISIHISIHICLYICRGDIYVYDKYDL